MARRTPDKERFVVTGDTLVAEVLKRIPSALELLISYGFTPLADPVIRRTVTPHVRLETGSRVHNLDLVSLLRDLNRLAGQAPASGARRASRRSEPAGASLTARRTKVSVTSVLNALRGCRDPEIPFNIVDLGLVYDVSVGDGRACITMTTSDVDSASAGQAVAQVVQSVQGLGVADVEVRVVREPPWEPSHAAPVARAALGWS